MAGADIEPHGSADATQPGVPERSEATVPITTQYGVSGIKRSGGIILEEYLPQLRGEQGRKVYQEMATHPIIGGALLAMREVVGRLDWQVVPPENPTPEEVQQATFVQECLEDMSDSWDVTLAQIMSIPTYGWAYFETVYKYRRGFSTNPEVPTSRFTDGRIGWRKIALRPQDTLAEWSFDPHGSLLGMIQYDQFTGQGRLPIPIERALLFRTEETKGNPEGRSMLRSAYTAWFYQKRIQELEAIGIERDFAGMPKMFGPASWFEDPNNENLQMLKDTVKKAKRNELDGVVLPSIIDEKGNRLVDFELVSSGGSRQIDTDKVIGRYNNAIATALLMDFLTLGHEGVGSYALGAAKITMWQLVVEALAKSIASVVNRHAIPRLMLLNGWRPDRLPQLSYGDVATADLSILGTFLVQMIENGVIVPDETLEGYVRGLLNLPEGSPIGRDNTDVPSVPGGDPTPAPAPEQAPVVPDAAPAPAPAEPTGGLPA